MVVAAGGDGTINAVANAAARLSFRRAAKNLQLFGRDDFARRQQGGAGAARWTDIARAKTGRVVQAFSGQCERWPLS
jgi:hypothetical protein